MTTIRTLVVGSCVSRDTFEHLPAGEYELVEYVARQSLISAFSPPVTLLKLPELASAFQQRMARWDYNSHLPSLLESTAGTIDLIVWDLIDERLGVYVLPDDTAVTRSVDMIAADAESAVAGAGMLIAFGDDAHHEMWRQSAAAFVAAVRRHHPAARLALIALPWAELTESGQRASESFRVPAARANPLFARYYDAVATWPDVDVLSRDADVRASEGHHWGEAPFHYTERTYRSVVAALTRRGATRPANPKSNQGDSP